MKRITYLFLILSISTQIFSVELIGTGASINEDEARKNALSDIAYKICTVVKSEFISDTVMINNKVTKSDKNLINVSTAVPLLGVEITVNGSKKKYTATAILNSEKSLPLYYYEIENKIKDIEEKYTSLNNEKLQREQKIKIIEDILKMLEDYKKYESVILFLGGSLGKESKVTEVEMIELINNYNNTIESLDDLTARITENYNKYSNIFVYPLKLSNYGGVTELSANIKIRIEKCLKEKSINDINKADYIMVGEYVIKGNELEIIYKLIDKYQNIKEVSIYKVTEKICEAYEYKPLNNEFYDNLNKDKIINNSFDIEIRLNNSYQNILYNKGDRVSIEVKMNKEGYFYLVGHNLIDKNNPYTYLLEINDTSGQGKFIFKVGEDEVNKWIILGEFYAAEPIGTETLQVIGSLEKLILPNYYYDEKTQLYKISGNPNLNLIETRGLIRKSGNNFSENSISYTILNN
ncbi:MAG: hypothetical protein KA157_05225 [Aliarcobacter sp.]|nr:hypothetical protein [Aliarcobacter sp.]